MQRNIYFSLSSGKITSITTIIIARIALKRGWTYKTLLPSMNMSILSYIDAKGVKQDIVVRNSRLFVDGTGFGIADYKDATYAMAEEYGLPYPQTLNYTGDNAKALAFMHKHKVIVVKPTDAGLILIGIDI